MKTLEANGGVLSSPTVSAKTGTNFKVPVPYREGWAFDGWFDSSGNVLRTDRGRNILGMSRSETWYAKWTQHPSAPVIEGAELSDDRRTITLRFSDDVQALYGTTLLCEDFIVNPSHAAFALNSRTCAVNDDASTVDITSAAAGGLPESILEFSVTYAGRSLANASDPTSFVHQSGVEPVQRVSFAVTFDENRGDGSSNTPVRHPANRPMNLPEPSREGFRFAGWFSAPSAGERVDQEVEGQFTPSEGVTLWAQWLADVAFEGEGIDSIPPVEINVNTDPDIILPAPQRPGFIFSGWFTNQDGGPRVGGAGDFFMPEGNTTLFARWQPVSSGRPDSRPSRPEPLVSDFANVLPAIPSRPGPLTGPSTLPPPAVGVPQPAPPVVPPPVPERPTRTGSLLQRVLGDAEGTIDLGSGIESVDQTNSGRPQTLLRTNEIPVRTTGEKRAEVLQGFAPGSTTEIEVVGARTGSRFALSAQAITDNERVAEVMASSLAASATDFFEVRSVEPVSAPEPKPSWDDSERNEVASLFESSGLGTPKSLNDFDVSGFTEWVKIESEAKTYVQAPPSI